MQGYKFNLGDMVKVPISFQDGTVVGRAEYTSKPPEYQVLHVSESGEVREEWFEAHQVEDAAK